MATRLSFLIGLFFAAPYWLHAQAELIEDNPILHHVYASVYWGVHSIPSNRTGFTAEYWWRKGKYSVSALGNPITLFSKGTPYSPPSVQSRPEMYDVHGLKKKHNWEVSFNYNRWIKVISKKRYIWLYTSGNIRYYTKGILSSLRLDGFRAGVIGYRNEFRGYTPGNLFQNIPAYTDLTTNYNSLFIFIGGQRTSVFNYKIQPAVVERRAYKATLYADLILGLGCLLHDVKSYPSQELVSLKPIQSYGFPRTGFRIGYRRMPGGYVGVGYCIEIGQLPKDPYQFNGAIYSQIYLRLTFNLGVTYPYKSMKFKEDNRLNNSHIGRDL